MGYTTGTYSLEKAPLRGNGLEEMRMDVLDQGFQTWMRDDKDYAITTRRGYRYRCLHAHRWLKEQGLKGLPWATEITLREYWNSVTPSAANRLYTRRALIAFFDYINTKGWRPDNPAKALPTPREPRRLPRPILDADTKKLLDVASAMGEMMSAMVHLLAYCGIRNSELRGLKWSDYENGWLRVVGKGNKERRVPVPLVAMAALRSWRNAQGGVGWMFPATRHPDRQMSPQTLGYLIQELSDIACVPVTPHVFRHTYATAMLEKSGGDLRTVQEALGHAKPETTAIYTRVAPTRIKEVADQLDYSTLPREAS